MARLNLTVPEALLARTRAEYPGLNISEVLRDALAAKVTGVCAHADLECAECQAALDRRTLVDTGVGVFFAEAMEAIAELAHKSGTAEGAARVLRNIGDAWGLTASGHALLPRPTRRSRQAALDAKIADLPVPPAARRRLRERVA